ncbi:MAG: hypothetical protein NC911_04355, partial [Candidatus Omnitrophica bacterium]|nr:hypothetical protein [Candidatus Omnitrophota bacterium]
MADYYEVIGCLHIHFHLNDGRQAFQHLGDEASYAGLDFLITTSHTPKTHRQKKEWVFRESGYYGRTLILGAEEL